MNFLAHLYFSGNNHHSLLGNLMGDFVKGRAISYSDRKSVDGIKLHRKIDKYTDSHPIVRQSKNRIQSERKRYAGIMIDVFYDHFLAKNWSRYSNDNFEQQVQNWYVKLNSETHIILPDRMRLTLKLMRDEDWLSTYKSTEGISNTIDRIAGRIRFENRLKGGGEELVDQYDALENDFNLFFRHLKHFVESERMTVNQNIAKCSKINRINYETTA